MKHRWFKDVIWKDVFDLKINPIWIPPIQNQLDT